MTKWWPNRQFTLLLSMAEVNAGMAKARAEKAPADSVLAFQKRLAKLMLVNKVNDNGMAPNSPIRPRRTSNPIHLFRKREQYQGKYDPEHREFIQASQDGVSRPPLL